MIGPHRVAPYLRRVGRASWDLRLWGKVVLLEPSAAARVMDHKWNSLDWHHER